HLKLEHPGRVNIGKRRNGIRPTDCRYLPERRIGDARVAIRRLSAPQIVSMVQEIESLQPQQDGRALRRLNAALHKMPYVGSRGTPECRLANQVSIYDRAI